MKHINNIVLLLSILVTLSCSSKKKDNNNIFVLNGTIKGMSDTKLLISLDYSNINDTVELKNEKFQYKKKLNGPTVVFISSIQGNWFSRLWGENTKMSLEATKGKYKSIIKGGEFQKGSELYYEKQKEINTKHKEYITLVRKYSLSAKEKIRVEKLKKIYLKDSENFFRNFITQNSEHPYTTQLIYERLTTKVGGQKASKLAPYFKLISTKLKNHPHYIKTKTMLDKMLKTEGGLEKFVKNVKDVNYKIDNTYKGIQHKNIFYLASFKNNDLCGLHASINLHNLGFNKDQEKKYSIINLDTKGNLINKFEIEIDKHNLPTSIAIDNNDNIYVLVSKQGVEKVKSRGRSFDRITQTGVRCKIYNKQGKKLKQFEIKHKLRATGARVYQNELYVSDNYTQDITVYNKENGTYKRTIKDLRPCCSILDFDIDKTGQILVANLGSFRVDLYTNKGKKQVSFGQRGKGINDFSGCCNPVSIRKLNAGAIVTVEKTPTRIKIYTSKGAKVIPGMKELVKGCFHIPIMSDNKDNIYLASPEKGIVKCILDK